MKAHSTLENLILYFVVKTRGFITKIQLVKFLYLADLYSVKWTGQQLTELDWYYYNHGPWHDEIDAALIRLEGDIHQKQEGKAILIQPDEKLDDDSTSFGFSEGLCLMLDNIRREWAGADSEKIKSLLEYVYSTAPMLVAKESYQPQERARLNLLLEREKLIEELGA